MCILRFCILRLIILCAFVRAHTLIFFFFFNDTATTEIYTLSLHDALPIWVKSYRDSVAGGGVTFGRALKVGLMITAVARDRKSTRLNSSHLVISYAVFCLKKKKNSSVLCSHRPSARTTPVVLACRSSALYE